MNALWLENQILTFRVDVPAPVPQPGEALVRVRLTGICSTDLELVRGYYPFTGVPGHEFVGEVVSISSLPMGGEGAWARAGERVVGEINAACGECQTCRAGRPTHCERRTVLGIVNRWGSLAEYVALPVENLHRVPDGVPDEAAVFTEPLAAALEITQQVQIRPSDRVLVLGAGRLGQLIAQVFALTGCDLQVAARHPHQRELLAARRIGVIEPEEIPDRRMDVVVEATGSPHGFHLARKAIRPRGVIMLKSTYKGDLATDFSSLVVDEITLVGSRCGPFAPALRLLESKQVDPLPLIAARYPLSDGLAAFQQAARSGVLKVLLQP
jgi:threonine dehydrogenase-like Zn-dependent dehydrogenase